MEEIKTQGRMEFPELKNSGVDWGDYFDTFPNRYLKESKLDFELNKMVSDIMQKEEWTRILDVGGGPGFTSALRRLLIQSIFTDLQVQIRLLDPFVKMMNYKDEMNASIDTEQVDWNHIENISNGSRNSPAQYDLIICRGSLNYLTLDQIEMLSMSVARGGILLANSFAEPVEIERMVKIGENGERTGKESCTYKKVGDVTIMKHHLEVDDRVIEHESYYHDPKDVMRLNLTTCITLLPSLNGNTPTYQITCKNIRTSLR